ncbi:MAG: peptide deformylase [Planctomycetaceae bacterium]|nr:peptide deformylase [Planctomycetaceae bacterium]
MKIVTFPHPTLRHESRAIRRVDAGLRDRITKMFELMYEAKGIGLAANQVDLPLRFFICNLAAKPDEGEELVFLNPLISKPKGSAEQEEGCLSLPGVYAPVIRPERIRLQAYRLDGQEIDVELDGLMARVVQHEVDHLDGVMFTDRLSATHEMNITPSLEEFQLAFESARKSGEIPPDEEIGARLSALEEQYGEPR